MTLPVTEYDNLQRLLKELIADYLASPTTENAIRMADFITTNREEVLKQLGVRDY